MKRHSNTLDYENYVYQDILVCVLVRRYSRIKEVILILPTHLNTVIRDDTY